jgi:hypothetical protein
MKDRPYINPKFYVPHSEENRYKFPALGATQRIMAVSNSRGVALDELTNSIVAFALLRGTRTLLLQIFMIDLQVLEAISVYEKTSFVRLRFDKPPNIFIPKLSKCCIYFFN